MKNTKFECTTFSSGNRLTPRDFTEDGVVVPTSIQICLYFYILFFMTSMSTIEAYSASRLKRTTKQLGPKILVLNKVRCNGQEVLRYTFWENPESWTIFVCACAIQMVFPLWRPLFLSPDLDSLFWSWT